jgi:predicted peptidase
MTRLLLSLLGISILSGNFSIAQNSRKYDSFEFSGDEFAYAYHLPANYDSLISYPVLIGPGEGTPDSDKSFFWNVEDTGKFGWILIEFSLWKQNSNVVKALMEKLNKRFNVEGDKFHIVGFSANSASSFGHAIANPDLFHSVTGMPGHPASNNKSQMEALVNVKVQSIVGEKDTYWLKAAKDFEIIYKEVGVNSILDVIPDGEHILRDLIGKGFIEKMEEMRK